MAKEQSPNHNFGLGNVPSFLVVQLSKGTNNKATTISIRPPWKALPCYFCCWAMHRRFVFFVFLRHPSPALLCRCIVEIAYFMSIIDMHRHQQQQYLEDRIYLSLSVSPSLELVPRSFSVPMCCLVYMGLDGSYTISRILLFFSFFVTCHMSFAYVDYVRAPGKFKYDRPTNSSIFHLLLFPSFCSFSISLIVVSVFLAEHMSTLCDMYFGGSCATILHDSL